MRRALGLVVGATFGITFVATCGTSTVGDSIRDMASIFGDGPLVDIAAANAQSAAMSAACDKTATRTSTSGNVVTSTTTYFAELAVPGLDPSMAPHLSILACDFQAYPGPVAFDYQSSYLWCKGGGNCTAGGYTPPANPCVTWGTGLVTANKLVVYCGQHDVTTTNGTVTSESGSLPTTIYVRVN